MTTSDHNLAREAILARSQPTTDQARTDRDVARLLSLLDTSDAVRWHEEEWNEKRLLACVAELLPVDERTLLGASPFPHGRPEAERRQRALRVLHVHRLLSDPDHAHEGEPYHGREKERVQESRKWQRGLLRFGDRAYERRWYELVREAAAELSAEQTAEREERRPLSDDALDAQAANLIARHPDRFIAAIAREVGADRRRLYEWPLSSAMIAQRRDDRETARVTRAERLRSET